MVPYSSVYDWTQRKRLLTFNNGNPTGSSITSLHCINQDVGGMIMAGSCMYNNCEVWDVSLIRVMSL